MALPTKSPGWFLARLKVMTPAELLHRGRSALRHASRRFVPPPPALPAPLPPGPAPSGRKADFFEISLDPAAGIDWSRDYRHGRSAPAVFYGQLDYRSFDQVGDSKYTWELNRHQFLLPWAWDFATSADTGAAGWVVYVILAWIAANPRFVGINWRSSLELALRILSWGIALDLCSSSEAVAAARARVAASVSDQARYIRGSLSEYSSANNHLMGELIGLLAASAYFPEIGGAARLAEYARGRVLKEVERQNFADGVNREQAVYYHHYAAAYMIVADGLWRRLGWPPSTELRRALRSSLEFVDAVTDDQGQAFDVGDRDDGFATGLNLGTRTGVYESLLWSGWALFGDPRMGAHAARIARSQGRAPAPDRSTVYWFGATAENPPATEPPPLRRFFREGGYFVSTDDGCCILFKGGPYGYPSIAAHSHCDQLSLLMRRDGRILLGDGGTGVYHTEERWRRFFKGTSAHNTVRVDGLDQAQYAGPFLWSTHADARLEVHDDRPQRFEVGGTHDGYLRLADPVRHERRLVYRQGLGYRVRDRLTGSATHRYELFWNFGPDVEVASLWRAGDGREEAWCVRGGDERVLTLVVRSSAPSTAEVRRGDEAVPAGFAAGRYLEWQPVPSLCVEVQGGAVELTTYLLTGSALETAADAAGPCAEASW